MNLENSEETPIIHEIEIKNDINDEFIQAIKSEGLLLISKGKLTKEKKFIERFYTIIYTGSLLTISFGDNVGFTYMIDKNQMLSDVSDEQILNVFAEDDRILALITYYSNFYPKLLDGVTNLTQNIVSKCNVEEDYSRKRDPKSNQ